MRRPDEYDVVTTGTGTGTGTGAGDGTPAYCLAPPGLRVLADRDGERLEFTGKAVVVSAGAANSERLLLMSANAAHPNGLAKGSGRVGRNYMLHNSAAPVAPCRRENSTQFQKSPSLNDFYSRDPDGSHETPMCNVQMIGKPVGPMFKAETPRFDPTGASGSYPLSRYAGRGLG